VTGVCMYLLFHVQFVSSWTLQKQDGHPQTLCGKVSSRREALDLWKVPHSLFVPVADLHAAAHMSACWQHNDAATFNMPDHTSLTKKNVAEALHA
jgi:hypothetical protein